MDKKLKLITLLVCIIVTIGQFYFKAVVQREKNSLEEFIKISGDGAQYVYSAENLFNGGDHAYFRTDKANLKSNFIIDGEFDKGMYYTFRTPGYSFIFIPLRVLFSHQNALIAVLVLQVLLSALSKFILCYFAFAFANRKKLALWIALFFTNALFFISSLNDSFLTEPFAGFFLLASFLLAYKAKQKEANLIHILAGISIMIAILLRPFLLPILGLFAFYILFNNKFNIIKTIFSKQLLFFIIPSILFLTGWNIRNYKKTEEVILLSKTFGWENFSNKGFKEIFYLVHNIGENHEWWVKKHLTHWYTNSDSKLDILSFNRISNLPIEQIKLIKSSREYYLASTDNIHTSLEKRQQLELLAEKDLLQVNNYIKSKHPEYRLYIPFETSYNFTSTPALTPFINLTYPLNVLSVFVECYFNRIIIFLGLIGAFVLLFRKRTDRYLKLIIISQLFIVVLFSLLGLNEKRAVFLPILLSLIPASIWAADLIKNKRYVVGVFILCIVGIMSIYDLPIYINF